MVIGYTQGTFDMFHIGHLNLIKHAKEKCDYLIVGVNTDELVKSYKQKTAIVPLEERMEIIDSIKYVDKVVSCDSLDKKTAYKKYNFNLLFIGDDWQGNPRWAETEREMELLGVKLVFLPYTKNTSSTVLREKLSEY